MTDEIIFHHYWTSPFSEKVRLTFGIKGLKWRSVEQPTIMPKPHLIPLTGGYRRIPVMQIGADIFCDSQIILREIERRYPEKSITDDDGLSYGLAYWADRIFFMPSVTLIFGAMGGKVDPAFAKDREALSGRPFDGAAMQAALPMMREQWRAHVGFIDAQLKAGGPFLRGDHPTASDLHAHMNVWFLAKFTPKQAEPYFAEFPAVKAWYEKVNAIGYGTSTKMEPAEAIAIAKAATSTTKEEVGQHEPNGLKVGAAVAVMADDYGRDPIRGTLVSASAQHVAIRRHDPEVGDVVVHFPRAGFIVALA